MRENNNEEVLKDFFKGFDWKKNAIAVEDPLANSYGLNLTDPTHIGYTYGVVQIEVSGTLSESNAQHLRLSLNIRKKERRCLGS